MANDSPSREADELVLAMIRWRQKGHITPVIGKQFGVTSDRVRTATNKVKDADTLSGEDITGAYW